MSDTESTPMDSRMAALEKRVTTLEDTAAIRRLHWAYGYYIDFNRPNEVADLFAEDGDLIRANDQMSRVAVRQGAGFFLGEAFDQIDRGLARAVAFIDVRRAADERQVQAGEQFAAISRA